MFIGHGKRKEAYGRDTVSYVFTDIY